MQEIKILKLKNGQMIIGQNTGIFSDTLSVTLTHIRSLVIVPSNSPNNLGISILPFMYGCSDADVDGEITFERSDFYKMADPIKELADSYISFVVGIGSSIADIRKL